MDIFMLVSLTFQVTEVIGKLLVFRQLNSNPSILACTAHVNGDALVWNTNLIWQYDKNAFKDRKGDIAFHSSYKYEDNTVDYQFPYDKWTLTDSTLNPMGLVLDNLWEDFQEYNYFEKSAKHFEPALAAMPKQGALAFSVRGSHDAHIIFCETNDYSTALCYWIIIGGWKNTKSVIRVCPIGIPRDIPPSSSSCAQKRDVYIHEPLLPTEWKHFVLTWNESTRNLTLYDEKKMLLTYMNEDYQEAGSNVSKYYFFHRSTSAMLFRYHVYSYLYTKNSSATLQGPLMFATNHFLCFRLAIGLCAKCSAEISLINSNGSIYEETLTRVEGHQAIHGLPTWQLVTFNKTIPETSASIRIQIMPMIEEYDKNAEGFWAVRSIVKCSPPETMRVGIIRHYQDYDYFTREYVWPNVTCQRMSHYRNEVVSVIFREEPLVTDDFDCPNGKLCSISCNYISPNFDKHCKNVEICETSGCACQAGLTGYNCNTLCGENRYGYKCKEVCGKCFHENCHYKTGLCTNQICDNNEVYHVPPYCKIEIDAPPEPTINFVNETYVHATLIAKDEYKTTMMEYTFVIRNDTDTISGKTDPIFPNTTILEGRIGDLKPGTFYWLSCYLIVKDEAQVIFGHSIKFMTSCVFGAEFQLSHSVTTLTIAEKIERTILHQCPFNLYNLEVREHETMKNIYNDALFETPFTLKNLEPSTVYEAIITDGQNLTIVSQIIQTDDGVPSPVRRVEATVFNNSNVFIKWSPPKAPNGKIQNYEVTLQVTTYRGCSDLKRSSPPTEILCDRIKTTNITFADLQPYTEYKATIYAWNSNRGESASIDFSIGRAKIPRSSYTNLRLTNDILTWSSPSDCSTISGPIRVARLIFSGVSDAIKNHTIIKETGMGSLDTSTIGLYGKETYKVRVYPIRNYHEDHNDSTCVELQFETPPKAPPQVKNLEIFEIDTRTNSISLRWQKPYPPNGELDHYSIASCYSKICEFYIRNVPNKKFCPLWDDYVCATFQVVQTRQLRITVYAINKGVNANGEYAYVDYYDPSEFAPGPPGNLTTLPYRNGVVALTWSHPWRARLPLKEFIIQAKAIDTNLKREINSRERQKIYRDAIARYQRRYTKYLDLLPSTRYELVVSPVTIDGKIGRNSSVSFETPASISFEGNLTYRIQSEEIICMQIPEIANDTKTSKLYVVVKGTGPCERRIKLGQYLEQRADIKYYEIVWLAVNSSTYEYSGQEFCIGDNATDAANCPLKVRGIYTIIVIVQPDENSTNDEVIVTSIHFGEISRRYDEIWIVPLVIVLIAVVAMYYHYRRRIQVIPKKLIARDNVTVVYNCDEVTSNLPKNERSLCQSRTDIPSPSIEASPNYEDSPTPIKVKDFEDYVKNAISSGFLDKQYEMLPRGQTQPCDYGKLPQNKPKNRYKNLVAYDETRVVLKKLQSDPFSDYINANYIKDYKKEKRYIATQGPKANTVIDFWRMIWQEKVLVICMLATVFENGKTKCEQYWPDIGKKKRYGDVTVFNAKHDVFADYTFRILHVTCEDETRQVRHLHYTAWPDHGVPMYTHSVVTYLKKLLATQAGSGPVVVHCSAGIGRTGTIILCDICLRHAAVEGTVDVFSETLSIRNQRINMVDNKQQFLFAHLVLVECLLALPTSLPCNDTLPAKIKDLKNKLHTQFQRLEDSAWQDEALIVRPAIAQTSLSGRNIAKNRYPELISNKVSRVYLKRFPLHDEDSDYIAAFHVDGFKVQNQFLASQLPLPSTFNDFWRMIAEFKVELIVMLQPPDPNDPTCCPIVPANAEFKPTPYINVIPKETGKQEYYLSHKLALIDHSEKPTTEQSVTILVSTKWEAGRNKSPPPAVALVTLWQATERIARSDGPTVVLCQDGITGCGLYLSLSFLLERMTIEKECDVCLAIRAVKRSRPDFVRSLDQMEYLYDAALIYMEYFETYANFS